MPIKNKAIRARNRRIRHGGKGRPHGSWCGLCSHPDLKTRSRAEIKRQVAKDESGWGC